MQRDVNMYISCIDCTLLLGWSSTTDFRTNLGVTRMWVSVLCNYSKTPNSAIHLFIFAFCTPLTTNKLSSHLKVDLAWYNQYNSIRWFQCLAVSFIISSANYYYYHFTS